MRIAKHKAFVPDALVAPLPEPAFDSLEILNPIIVVEVLSPSTARMDATTEARAAISKVASVQHYLIIDPESRDPSPPQARKRCGREDAHCPQGRAGTESSWDRKSALPTCLARRAHDGLMPSAVYRHCARQ